MAKKQRVRFEIIGEPRKPNVGKWDLAKSVFDGTEFNLRVVVSKVGDENVENADLIALLSTQTSWHAATLHLLGLEAEDESRNSWNINGYGSVDQVLSGDMHGFLRTDQESGDSLGFLYIDLEV